MTARPIVLRAAVLAVITGLLAACSNPTAPTQTQAKASLGVYAGSSG